VGPGCCGGLNVQMRLGGSLSLRAPCERMGDAAAVLMWTG
jgi:hypothetical protein